MATVAKSTRSTTITLASASAGPFDLDFRLFDSDGLNVYVNGLPRTDWTLNATYVDGYDDNATITFDAALSIGDVIIVDSALYPRRDIDYIDGPGLTEKLNVEFARIWSAMSDNRRELDRSARVFGTSSPIDLATGQTFIKSDTGFEAGPDASAIADAQANATAAAASAASAALYDGPRFDTVADMVADTAMNITNAPAGTRVMVGNSTEYEVTNQTTQDFTVTTAGGLQLKVVADTGLGFAALGASVYEARTPSATSPTVICSFANTLWGYYNGRIYSKASEASAWVDHCAAPMVDNIATIQPMSDGEVVVVTSSKVFKSSGWGGTLTWSEKFTTSGGTAIHLPFSSAGSDGVNMIVGEYATGSGGAGWENSQKVYGTKDSGATWQVIYDAATLYPADYTNTHIHGCAYDPWQDVWLVVEGHTANMGIYWNADPFTNPTGWTRIEKGPLGVTRTEGQPTCIVPTDKGIVCASDAPEQGVWVIQRGNTPADMSVHWLWEWPAGRGGTLGFGQCWTRDPETGVVYMGYRHNYVADSRNKLMIVGCDGTAAGYVWLGDETTIPATGTYNNVSNICVTPWGTVEAQTDSSSAVGAMRIAGVIQHGADSTIDRLDAGGVMGGEISGIAGNLRAGAYGLGAVASGIHALAVGPVAQATAQSATAIGTKAKATGVNSVAIGDLAEAGLGSFSMGYNIKTKSNDVVIGSNRDLSALSGVVSIGATQTVNKNNVVAVGDQATVTFDNGVAVGWSADVSGFGGTALGHNTSVTHAYSSAIGRAVATTGAYQTNIGATYLEMGKPTSLPAGHTGAVRLYVDNGGAGGKQRLMAIFQTGVAQVVALEP